MFSRDIPAALSIGAILFAALTVGVIRGPGQPKPQRSPAAAGEAVSAVPSIGRIQVLNGCGVPGAADRMTDFLRARKFNVANTGNASSWNYPSTLVVSSSKNLTVAGLIAAALRTDHLVLMRKEDHAYDVTVIIGPDWEERIK